MWHVFTRAELAIVDYPVSGEHGLQLATFHDDAEVMAEAGKLAGILGTRVDRDGD